MHYHGRGHIGLEILFLLLPAEREILISRLQGTHPPPPDKQAEFHDTTHAEDQLARLGYQRSV